jgi:hypothetical protein
LQPCAHGPIWQQRSLASPKEEVDARQMLDEIQAGVGARKMEARKASKKWWWRVVVARTCSESGLHLWHATGLTASSMKNTALA